MTVGTPGAPRLFSQIRSFRIWLGKCTYSRAVLVIFRAAGVGGQKPASVIGSGIVKQRGAPVVLFNGKETHTRSVLKAVSWRILGTLDTFVISWYLTGRVALAGSIAALEFLTKIAWYYAHERVWASIAWGRGTH